MALTQAEVLDLFNQVTAIKNSDQILMITANQNGTVSATKITAELLRAYLNRGFEVTIGNDGYFYIGGVKTTVMANSTVIVNQTDTTVAIDPNVLNVWGEVRSLAISLNDGAAGRENEFKIQFKCPSNHATTVALPSTVSWANGEPIETEPGWTYQISIINNLAIYAGWEDSNT